MVKLSIYKTMPIVITTLEGEECLSYWQMAPLIYVFIYVVWKL